MSIYRKIRRAYQIYVGDLRLILADEDIHLNCLTRQSLEKDVQIAQLNMLEIDSLSKDVDKFERDFKDVKDWDDEVILSFILTDPNGRAGKKE